MKKVLQTLEQLCKERNLNCFYLESPEELWISGYQNNKKFDLFVRRFPDGYIKLVFEVPEERKPILFHEKEEDKIIQKVYLLLEEKKESEKEEEKEHIFTQITGLMSDDKLVEMYLKNKKQKSEDYPKEP
ncbi:MAG: hypothetical protein GXO22_01755 [Aquificae bacterium]|nr:hypothetical protein [Aquificota bacterium]